MAGDGEVADEGLCCAVSLSSNGRSMFEVITYFWDAPPIGDMEDWLLAAMLELRGEVELKLKREVKCVKKCKLSVSCGMA